MEERPRRPDASQRTRLEGRHDLRQVQAAEPVQAGPLVGGEAPLGVGALAGEQAEHVQGEPNGTAFILIVATAVEDREPPARLLQHGPGRSPDVLRAR